MNTHDLAICSHTGFQKLKSVLVGDVYPESFSEALPKKHRELFLQLQELTTRDLNALVAILTQLGVAVYRPDFATVDKYLDDNGNLGKPPITPRDWAMTLGDTLYITPQYTDSFTSIEKTIDQFRVAGQKIHVLDRSRDAMAWITFPSVVRIGKDLLVDILDDSVLDTVLPTLKELAKSYRVHISRTGDHSDGVFCPVKPGWIYSTHYRSQYEHTFPKWQITWLADTTQRRGNGYNGRWWLPDCDYAHFNTQVFEFADKWIGNSSETVFEVNMLVIDEQNILVIAEDDRACKQLESLGFKVHVINIRSRGFWDGGLHCLTTDLYREGTMCDYWPTRGDTGLYYHE